MRFICYGVTLERLSDQQIETIRAWRNSDWVRPMMRYRDVISPEQQRAWFDGLDACRDWYFCTSTTDRPFGLFHVKGVDWSARSGEAGGFVGERDRIGGPEAARATLALMDFAFAVLELETLNATYRGDHHAIKTFNAGLGYEIRARDTDGFVAARVTADRYFRAARSYRMMAARRFGAGARLTSPDAWLANHLGARDSDVLRCHDFDLELD